MRLYKAYMLFDHPLAWSDENIYKEIYDNSLKYPNEFWMHHSKTMFWKETPKSAYNAQTNQWLDDGISNVCYNCVDRHALENPDKPAIIWHGDEPGERLEISYKDLQKLVIKIASLLKSKGISKGDVVGIYMPLHYISIATMLACARIGATHLVVFAGFAPDALAYRLDSSNAKMVLSMTSSRRGGRKIDLKHNVENAISKTKHKPELVFLDDIEKTEISSDNDQIEWVNSNDNLFMLYTSGSSGKPKGIIHSALPYILYVSTTFKTIFDIKPDDVYFCTSDIGWITGHSYITYAPLFLGTTVVIFEGNPTYPTADRYWEIIEKEKVTVFYTAPTAIRSLQMFNKNFVHKHDLSSLRILGSVGEPINESAWKWYFEIIGNKKCPIIDTWWQTETGGIILAPLNNLNQKPGVAGRPFFGISPKIIDSKLKIENNWPGRCKAISYEHQSSSESFFKKQYFDENGLFITGDGAKYTDNNNIKITGRVDDVINISGHRLSTAEFEDAINRVSDVKESAVVAVNHEIKGQTAFAYVVINQHSEDIVQKIITSVRRSIGPIAKPDFIAFVNDLPKTRSGKIVRHLLRDIAQNTHCDSKDISSVANHDSIENIKIATSKALNCPDLCVLKKAAIL